MAITSSDIPEQIRSDKSVTPFIARAAELETVNPVVSYYCKLHVLDHILSNKLHTTSKEVEVFTIALLDDTESVKNSHEDENVCKVLADKNLSLSVVLSFAYKLFNSCLQGISEYGPSTNKGALVSKMQATLNFLTLLGTFATNGEDISWGKLTGGKASDGKQFEQQNKEKIKILKYQLSRLLKDEIAFKNENDDELEKELEQLEVALPEVHAEEKQENELESGQEKENAPDKDGGEIKLPGAPTFLPDSSEDLASTPPSLPRAPDFAPDQDSDAEFKLPGAPKYLPDDDLSQINKNSSIQIIPPGRAEAAAKKSETKPKSHTPDKKVFTKQEISSIVDKQEQVAKIQKLAKFAVSALNYEDIDTAERELKDALELLRVLKESS